MLKTASSNKQSPHWKKNRLEVLKGCRAPAHVFPARAGMSPSARLALSAALNVPRASGDEPKNAVTGIRLHPCSLRERG